MATFYLKEGDGKNRRGLLDLMASLKQVKGTKLDEDINSSSTVLALLVLSRSGTVLWLTIPLHEIRNAIHVTEASALTALVGRFAKSDPTLSPNRI